MRTGREQRQAGHSREKGLVVMKKKAQQSPEKRTRKLQLMLSPREIEAIDRWRHTNRMPTRAAAIRFLLQRGMREESGSCDPPAD